MTEQTSPRPERPAPVRRVLLLAHTGREDAREVARAFCKALTAHGIVVRLLATEAADLGVDPAAYQPGLETVDEGGAATAPDPAEGCELAVVIGEGGRRIRADDALEHVA